MDDGATFTNVSTRLDRVTQYSRALVIESQRRGVLDPRFRGDDSNRKHP
jgi:hypothetical protein